MSEIPEWIEPSNPGTTKRDPIVIGNVISLKRQDFYVNWALIELEDPARKYFKANKVPTLKHQEHIAPYQCKQSKSYWGAREVWEITGVANITGGRWYFKYGCRSSITAGISNGVAVRYFRPTERKEF